MKTQNSVSEKTYRDIDHILYEMGLKKIEARRVDDYFQNMAEQKETKFLSRMSHILINLWDLASIIAKLRPGESLIIHGDSGRMFRGKISEEKLAKKCTELREKVPGRVSLTIDGNGRNENLLAKGSPIVFGRNPQKKSGDTCTRVYPRVSGNADLYLFEEMLQNIQKEDVTVIEVEIQGHKYLETSIKNYPTKIGSGKSGRIYYTKTGGEITWLSSEK